MTAGKTKSGFKFEISNDISNDYELVEQLVELEDDSSMIIKIVNKLLGKEQANKLKEHLRTDTGVVPFDLMMEEVEEIFEISGKQTKNS